MWPASSLLILTLSFEPQSVASQIGAPSPERPDAPVAPPTTATANLAEASSSSATTPSSEPTEPAVQAGLTAAPAAQPATKSESVLHDDASASLPANGDAIQKPLAIASTQASEVKSFEVSGAPGKGFTIRNVDDSYQLTLRARIQARETVGFGEKTTNEINIRTVRFFAQGHVFSPKLRYTVQLAFGPGEFDSTSPTPIFDAFVDYTQLRDISIKVGQFFVPFDRARTIREFALQLVDRQQAVSELNLDRDVGLSIYSSDLFGLGGRLNYSLGIFGGDGRNRVGALKPGFLYTARVGVRPFGEFDDDLEGDLKREAKPRLALGIAGAYNDNTDRQRSTIGKALTAGTFDYTHAAADLVFKWRGFSLLSEVLYRKANRDQNTKTIETENVTEYSRSGWGYLAQAGLMVSPKIEVAARWDQTFAIGQTDPTLRDLAKKQGHELGGGLNWYLNGHYFKIQADYSVRFDQINDKAAHVARLQLDATF